MLSGETKVFLATCVSVKVVWATNRLFQEVWVDFDRRMTQAALESQRGLPPEGAGLSKASSCSLHCHTAIGGHTPPLL